MSWVYWRLGLWDDADRMMERIRSIDPHNVLLFMGTQPGWRTVRGDKVTAIELAEKYLALYPEELGIHVATFHCSTLILAIWKQPISGKKKR